MTAHDVNLNARAAALCQAPGELVERLGVETMRTHDGTLLISCGRAKDGVATGLLLARVCLADLATVAVDDSAEGPWPLVRVSTEQPVLACLASQYAGWELKAEGFFAMGSGPMRAGAAREPLFADIGYRESAEHCVGVLESSKLPPRELCDEIAAKCGVAPANLTLLVAPTSSAAGTLQIVARSVETVLHKLHELKFDLSRIVSGEGSAPLPPLVDDDLAAIGRTNDAILYGARVTLHVRGNDESLAEIGPRVPSCVSPDYGRPFAETLKANNYDFYRIDPLLFSPAQVTFVNVDTGRSLMFGETNDEMLARSFGA